MTLYYSDDSATLHHGDALAVARELASGSVDCIVTSPPYFGLRDYGVPGQYGLEASPAEYVETMRALFSELRRVLVDDGTVWINLGDSYSAGGQGGNRGGKLDGGAHLDMVPKPTRVAGVPPKNLLGIPWRVAFALQDDGWYVRNAIVWHKSNAMPESVTDRLSSRYEMVFMFSKSRKYWFDLDAVREPVVTERPAALSFARDSKEADVPGQHGHRQHRPTRPDPAVRGKASGVGVMPNGAQHTAQHDAGRNPGDVWTLPTTPFAAAHFAVMALGLAERAVQAGCPPWRCRKCGAAPTRTTGERILDLSRPQARRAQELADAAGLTREHIAAIRSAGVTDSGKAATNQNGTGKNTADVQQLADEAKAALGGYYREFLLARPESTGWTNCGHNDFRHGLVLDPFSGSGTTGLAAARHGRDYMGIDLSTDYLDLSLRTRLRQPGLDLEVT